MAEKKHKIYCIMGKFASGKTTIAKILEEKYGFKRVITCTTRAKRGGEREGADYYYITDEEFEDLANDNKLVAINRVVAKDTTTEVKGLKRIFSRHANKVKYSKKYGVPIDRINLEENSYICVIEPSGYFDLVEKFDKDCVKCIYLNLNDKERWLRALNRELNPDVEDMVSKYIEELNLYDGFETKCDKLIDNVGTSDNATVEVYNYIMTSEEIICEK